MKSFLINFFFRRLKDGRKRAGLGIFLFASAGVFMCIYFALHPPKGLDSHAKAQSFLGLHNDPNPAAKDIALGGIASQSLATARIDQKPPQPVGFADSFRRPPEQDAVTEQPEGNPRSAAEAAFNDSVGVALAGPKRKTPGSARNERARQGQGAYDGSGGESDGGNNTANTSPDGQSTEGDEQGGSNDQGGAANMQEQRIKVPSMASLAIVQINDQPTAETASGGAVSAPAKTFIKATHYLQRGERIPVYLLTTIQTGDMPSLVEFAVATNVYYDGELAVPFGTRILGTVAQKSVRARIILHADSFRFPGGLQIAVEGIALGEDQGVGVPAYYIPPPLWDQIAPYIGTFATAYATFIQSEAASSSINIGTVSYSQAINTTGQAALLQAAAQAIGDYATKSVAQVQEFNAPYLTIPEGTACYVQVLADVNLDAAFDLTPRERGLETVGKPNIIDTVKVLSDQAREKAYLTGLSTPGGAQTVQSNSAATAGTPPAKLPPSVPSVTTP
jgi:hypothetical protein